MGDASQSREALGRQILQAMLSQIPTLFGRLEFLASLRNSRSGAYEHAVLIQVIDREELDRLLRYQHRQVFTQWLASSLEEQKTDLTAFLNSPDRSGGAGEGLSRLAAHAELVPPGARPVERQLYFTDWETLLGLLDLTPRDGFAPPGA
jgi:hypothetical protein